MVIALGLSISMMASPSVVRSVNQPAIQGEVLDKVIPSIDVTDIPLHELLSKLFTEVKTKYRVEPGIDQNTPITLKINHAKFELILQNVLAQVGATFRYEGKNFDIIDRREYFGISRLDYKMTEFLPGSETSKSRLTNAFQFLTPKRTIGGTLDLFLERARTAGFDSWNVLSYGRSGFALLMPFESIDQKGKPLPKDDIGRPLGRFSFDMPYLTKYGFDKLNELFGKGYANQDHDYRMIVLTFRRNTAFVANREIVMKELEQALLPEAVQKERWKSTPTVTAFVYEFRRPPGQHLAVLLKPGESKISARQHLILAGLWTDKELR